MARERSVLRWLRTLTVLTAVTLPALGLTAVNAAAHGSAPLASYDSMDDIDTLRMQTIEWRAEVRLEAAALARATKASKAARAPASFARASRSLVRAALKRNTYVRPVPGPVTQWYGSHPGIDIAPPFGTPIVAAHSGVVTFVGWEDGYGMHVEVVQLDGYVTTYSHMSAFTVTVGQLVVAGQQLGNVGSTGWSTGPHLHFEVHLPGGARMDPAVWLREHHVEV